ncbi:MAG: 23S rRNA (guanosine(2251)-2'-O)-methyltransferase RlmB [Anaerolineae bacterium]|jgi:23S rRNA (guanosine2251-2'-O)-methyltransferase|uniref:23S rRNA (guanosine(2251)-2'-O)-methyltransferase RlmB n=1 Tax=Candidatus Flexifilum breve TaxID=3140694 RepID=UPI001AC62A6C|nr:23S rRNA (guanosine(2251)-2'-O)-methyltransferase RlmB [Chloroflexota bacterium]MBK9746691.1 23S rRNA (guanosine(2251)-2'-O)-methyltransferase RlmB [Chloroflexota bacterium]MBN8635869.1 23S rRNA (guanosine(2251)-2'-O)-methyltransferase RlmB [Anaerolineae bacterium]
MSEFLYGHWAIMETLRAGRRQCEQLVITETVEEKGIVAEIIGVANERGVKVKKVQRRIIDDLAQGANHQNMALRASPYPYVEVPQVLELGKTRGEKPFILLLDLLKDPQNVGVLMRVADAVGIHGVILQDRRGVDVTPAVVNASSGAVEHLQIVRVTNLVQTMRDLKEQDVWMVGLDIGPNVPPIDKTDLNMSIGIVLGSEGEGMRRLVRDTCDLLLALPMRGAVASLNVATVGSVALYAAWQARGWQGWAHA